MRRAALVCLLACVALDGCHRRETAPAPRSSADDRPRSGGRLVRRLNADVQTLNYLLHTGEEERQVLAYLYDPLIALDVNLEPIPGIVSRWDIADGGKTYVLHLDRRATFSDGTAVKASDVVFTLKKIVDANAPQFAGAFTNLDRARTVALDEHTVRVGFTETRAAQLLAFNISVVPEHVYGKGTLTDVTAVVGNGPYVLKAREPGRSIIVERRSNYWREAPFIDTVLFRVVADDSVAWNALMGGDLDVARVNNDTWWRERNQPAVREMFTFVDAWLLSYNCIAWNLDDPLFKDAATRRALAMSFDRDAVIKNLYHGEARPVTGPFTPDQWANDSTVPAITFDLGEAAKLLAAAGWRDTDGDGTLDRAGHPFTFTLLTPVSTAARDQSQILQSALAKLGIRMEIATMDGAAFFDRVLHRNFQAAFFAWFNEPDPDPYALFHSSQTAPIGLNVGAYTSREADALMDAGRVELDRGRRAAIYHELHRLLARDQPYLWTVQVASKWAVNRRVHGVHPSKGLGLFLWYPGPFAWWLN